MKTASNATIANLGNGLTLINAGKANFGVQLQGKRIGTFTLARGFYWHDNRKFADHRRAANHVVALHLGHIAA